MMNKNLAAPSFGSIHATSHHRSGGKTMPQPLLLLALLLTFLLCRPTIIVAQPSSTISHRGKSFIFALPSGSNPVTVAVAAVSIDTVVNVEYPQGVNSSFVATPDEFAYWSTEEYSYPDAGDSISDTSAIRVYADQDVVVYMSTGDTNFGEKSLALPIASLNTKYVILDYAVTSRDYAAEFSVTAVFGKTIVRITPSTPLTGHSVIGKTYQVVLKAGQTYYGTATYRSKGATGTIIEANKRVAVTNGFNIARNSFEMAQPVQNWGTSYVSALLGSNYRIVVSQNNTLIKLNGNVLTTLSPLKYKEIYDDSSVSFTSTKPFFVAQFYSMVNLIPVAQYLNKYTIGINSDEGGSLIYITARQSDVGKLKLNGVAVDADTFQNINGTNLAAASVAVDDGTYTTSSAHGHGLIACERNYFTYGCFAGGFKKTNPPTRKPTLRPTNNPTLNPSTA